MSPSGGHPGQRGAIRKTGSWDLGVARQLQSREGQSPPFQGSWVGLRVTGARKEQPLE